MNIFRPGERLGFARRLHGVVRGALALVLASYVLLTTSGLGHHSMQAAHAAPVELDERHHGTHPHAPGSGQHGDICSVTACSFIAMMHGGAGYVHLPVSRSAGLAPLGTGLRGVDLVDDPPVPRIGPS